MTTVLELERLMVGYLGNLSGGNIYVMFVENKKVCDDACDSECTK